MFDRGQRRPRFRQAVGATGVLTLWTLGSASLPHRQDQ